MKAKKDPAQRTFSLHWGSGVIEEEVQIETQYHRPTIQLLKFTEGEAAGTYDIRFCHYDLRGRFQRSPLIVSGADMVRLRKAVKAAPRLKKFLGLL